MSRVLYLMLHAWSSYLISDTNTNDSRWSTKAMTGWRLGFGLFPDALVEPARNLAINSWTCLLAVNQKMGFEDFVQEMR